MTANNSQWLTAQQAADHLQVHVETLYRLAAEGEVTGRKLGGRWRFSTDDLANAGRTIEPTPTVKGTWRETLRAVNPYEGVA